MGNKCPSLRAAPSKGLRGPQARGHSLVNKHWDNENSHQPALPSPPSSGAMETEGNPELTHCLSQCKGPSSEPGLARNLFCKLPEATTKERTALRGPLTRDRSDLPDALRQSQGSRDKGATPTQDRRSKEQPLTLARHTPCGQGRALLTHFT